MCALSPNTMSAHEDEEKGGVVDEDEEDDEEEEECDSMKDSAQLAPTHFNVSITTSNTDCDHKEIDRAVSVSTSVSFCRCRLCGRRRRPLSCADCVNAGHFVHSKADWNGSSSTSSSTGSQALLQEHVGVESKAAASVSSYRVKSERLAALKSLKAQLTEQSLDHVNQLCRLEEWSTRVLLQEEKLRSLRRAVEQKKAVNRSLKDRVGEMKERAEQMRLRRRKHNEKVAKIQRFLPHSTARRDEKVKLLDSLKEELKTWRRSRIEDLVKHIFVVEGVGQTPMRAGDEGPASVARCLDDSFDPSASTTPTSSSPTRLLPPLPVPPSSSSSSSRVFVADDDRLPPPPRLNHESSSKPFVPTSHSGDPPNRKCISRGVGAAWEVAPRGGGADFCVGGVVPLLLEVNQGFGVASRGAASHFVSRDDELPPTQLPVCQDILDEDLLIVDDEDDDDDDDDDLIVSELENSLAPIGPSQQDNGRNDQIYGNPKPQLESYYRIIRPTLPASGDLAHILPLIVQSQKTSTPTLTVPDPATGKLVQIEGHSSPRRIRIEKDLMQNAYAGLALTAQLVTCLSFYLDVILPKKVGPADFMIKSAKVSSFVKSLNKLNTNVLFLCFSQYVPHAALHPTQTIHNIQMLLNTTVTPHLGSINHFRVDEALLDSLEESVVIVGNASSNSNEADMDFSSSSSSSDDEGKDEASSGEWDYIPADMNIPSLPINEGFVSGSESSTLTGGLSSYSITGAAASVASWWRSNR